MRQFILICTLSALGGCGLKGDLYLPKPPAAAIVVPPATDASPAGDAATEQDSTKKSSTPKPGDK